MVKKIFAKGYIFLILALMYAPILLLSLYSFTNTTTLGTWNGFSLTLYKKLFQNKELMTAVGNTLLLAFTSSI